MHALSGGGVAAVLGNAVQVALEPLRDALVVRLEPAGRAWLRSAVGRAAADPASLARSFPEAGRRCGRGPLPWPDGRPPLQTDVPCEALAWTVDDAARALLLAAVPRTGRPLAQLAEALYRHGDAGERRGALRALALLPVEEHAVDLSLDALRTNDPRLMAAALGPYGARHLDPDAWRQAVLKCLHTGVPLAVVAGLCARRREPELVRMAEAYAHELRRAGRPLPADLHRLTDPGECL